MAANTAEQRVKSSDRERERELVIKRLALRWSHWGEPALAFRCSLYDYNQRVRDIWCKKHERPACLGQVIVRDPWLVVQLAHRGEEGETPARLRV